MARRHLIIPDAQIKPGQNLDHIDWAAKAIVEYRPDVIVVIGDWWDMSSLSTHEAPGSKEAPAYELPGEEVRMSEANPKTLTGRRKLPTLSVIPPTALLYLGMAMKYGAHDAPKVDGTTGYGPYNWRDQPIEASVYIDATIRHLMRWWDGTEVDADSGKPELAHAMASLAILADAIENGTVIDDRPKVRHEVAARILARETVSNVGVTNVDRRESGEHREVASGTGGAGEAESGTEGSPERREDRTIYATGWFDGWAKRTGPDGERPAPEPYARYVGPG